MFEDVCAKDANEAPNESKVSLIWSPESLAQNSETSMALGLLFFGLPEACLSSLQIVRRLAHEAIGLDYKYVLKVVVGFLGSDSLISGVRAMVL